MQNNQKKIAVTYALPYANGSLHLGHLVGFIQTDVWVRFKKMLGADCLFLCGCDGHGTPIMIQAEKMNISPEELIENIRIEHKKDLNDFLIGLDNYHTTDSTENHKLVEEMFKRHNSNGNIHKKTIKQAFDPEKKMFLPDRYIKGDCPTCSAKDQYGDSCEVCGATYSPIELKNSYSTLSGATPIEKESEHYFFKLQNFETMLKEWTKQGHLQTQVINKLDEWFKTGLKDWDISRDSPYFGFKIPGEENKYFYVWLDAPIGYMASFQNLAQTNSDLNFSEYWESDEKTELYHFIGKDIMYFHTLFWPALLKGASYRTPNAIYCHGFLTINGQKMSKSRGTFIKASTYLKYLDPQYLRYYLCTKLNDRIEDLDINFEDFTQRVNSDLIGKFINIASRSASFIHKYFNGFCSDKLENPELFEKFEISNESIANKYKNREFSHAIREIMSLADLANQYIDENKPWTTIKNPDNKQHVHEVCTMGINLFKSLMIYLKPILPEIAKKSEIFLNINPLQWSDINKPLLKHKLNEFTPLATRLDKKQIEALQLATKEEINQSI
ncbi:methionine--tRNA ligase [Gammaproteobacteria bacterium]|nr:methionine--tRNA ligase [Gammaproteobacteria bacterium]